MASSASRFTIPGHSSRVRKPSRTRHAAPGMHWVRMLRSFALQRYTPTAPKRFHPYPQPYTAPLVRLLAFPFLPTHPGLAGANGNRGYAVDISKHHKNIMKVDVKGAFEVKSMDREFFSKVGFLVFLGGLAFRFQLLVQWCVLVLVQCCLHRNISYAYDCVSVWCSGVLWHALTCVLTHAMSLFSAFPRLSPPFSAFLRPLRKRESPTPIASVSWDSPFPTTRTSAGAPRRRRSCRWRSTLTDNAPRPSGTTQTRCGM